MPRPGAGDDFVHVLELRLPAEFGADFFRAGDEARRVAGAARLFEDGDFFAGDLFARAAHCANFGGRAPVLQAHHSRLSRHSEDASFSAMSITAIVENDTIKLPMHVPDGTRVEITLPGESAVRENGSDPFDAMIGAFHGKAEATGRTASAGQSFYDAAHEFIGMFEGPSDLSTNTRHLDDFGK